MRHAPLVRPLIAGMLLICVAACSESRGQDESRGKTVIDGRTFEFEIPATNPPPRQVPEAFIIGALNTPSPPPEVYTPYNELLFDNDVRKFVLNYLENRPPATEDEIQALIERTKGNLIFVQGGSFVMGDFGYLTEAKRPMSDSTLDDPPHEVTLDSYSLMKNRVTYQDYDVYTRATGLGPVGTRATLPRTRFPDFAAFVTWVQARDYCLWLAKRTAHPFDLDTSAQYEYAARSKGQWRYIASTFQERDQVVPDMRAFAELMEQRARGLSPDMTYGVPIGTYGSNHIGFEDMVGEAHEWVYDWYAPYEKTPKKNPRGPAEGAEKVQRTSNYDYQGTITRGKMDPDKPFAVFRCAVNSEKPIE